MNRKRGQISTISIVLLIVCLVVGAVGSYFAFSSTLDQKIRVHEATTLALEQEIITYEDRVTVYKSQVIELEGGITDYESQIADLDEDITDYESEIADLETEKSIHEQKIKDYEATQAASAHILSIYESQVLSLREDLEDLDNTYGRALENCMLHRRWEVFAIYTGTANASGELHFTTGDILIRAGEVKLDIRTYSNRYEFLEVEMHPVGRGYTAYNLPWIYDSHSYEKLSTDPFPYNRIYGYENIDSGEIYQLEITGRYTEELIRKLDAGMTVEEDLYEDYDYMIKIFIPEDS